MSKSLKIVLQRIRYCPQPQTAERTRMALAHLKANGMKYGPIFREPVETDK